MCYSISLSLSLCFISEFLSIPLINQTYWWLDIILILFAVYGLFIESIDAFFCIKSTTAIGFRYETTSCCIKAIRMTRTHWLFPCCSIYMYIVGVTFFFCSSIYPFILSSFALPWPNTWKWHNGLVMAFIYSIRYRQLQYTYSRWT